MVWDKLIFEGIILIYILGAICQQGGDVQKNIVILVAYSIIKLLYYNWMESDKCKWILFVIIAGLWLVTERDYAGPFYILVGINIVEIFPKVNEDHRWMPAIIASGCLIWMGRTNPKESVFFALLSFVGMYYIEEANKKKISNREVIFNLEEEKHSMKIQQQEINKKMKTLGEIAQMEERHKISQNIHDSIGHTLAGSLMQLQGLRFIIKDEQQKEILDRVISELRNGMDDTRMILRKIKPDEHESGVNRIKKLCLSMEDKGLKVYFKNNSSWDISSHQWEVIYENIKEGFTNIFKYSKATEVFLEISELNKFVKIELRDNGIGCENINSGMGLRGMEDRMKKIGGQLIVDGHREFSVIQILPKGEKI